MDLYLPIAGLSVNALVIIGLGGLVGLLTGMVGVGGGFLTTPILIFYGIPPAVAVASATTQITRHLGLGRAHPSPAPRRRHADGRGDDRRRHRRLDPRRLPLPAAPESRPDRYRHLDPLRPPALLDRPADGEGGGHRARHLEAVGARAGARPPPPQSDHRRSALSLALLPFGPLHLAAGAARPRLRLRHAHRPARRRRRLHHGAGDDLPARHVGAGRGRHLAAADPVRHHRHHHRPRHHHPLGRRRARRPAADRLGDRRPIWRPPRAEDEAGIAAHDPRHPRPRRRLPHGPPARPTGPRRSTRCSCS